MSIPLATTTITIRGTRPSVQVDPDADGFDAPSATPAIVASGLNACISGPVAVDEGGAVTEMWNLRVDRCDLKRADVVVDDVTGDTYYVSTVTHSKIVMFGLDHTHALLKSYKGLPDGHSTAP